MSDLCWDRNERGRGCLGFLTLLAALSLVSSVGCGGRVAESPRATSASTTAPLASTPQNQADAQADGSQETVAFEAEGTIGQPTRIDRIDDPTRDGWESEAFATAAKKKLQQLSEVAQGDDRAKLSLLAMPDATARGMRPSLKTVNDDASIIVKRAEGDDLTRLPAMPLRDALTHWLASYQDRRAVRIKFKIVGVDLVDGAAHTDCLVHTDGEDAVGASERNAFWRVRWSDKSATSRVVAIEVMQLEAVSLAKRKQPLFADCTESVMATNASYREQLLFGQNHWRRQMAQELRIHMNGLVGLAIGDFNGDDLDDIYLTQPTGLPNRMYLQQRDGSLLDYSQQSKANWLESSRGALAVDLDNDGTQDLAAVVGRRLVVMQNDGGAHFTEQFAWDAGGQPISISAADYDRDGDLDLYVCCYTPSGGGGPVPYYDAMNGGRNVLLRNEGGFQFADATESSGISENNNRWSFASAWEDYDNDGDLDVYVANDFGRNNLYRNDGQRFTDVAAAAGVEDMNTGMSVSWGDYDNDGWMDLYVANMFSAAGNRILPQRQFKPHAVAEVRSRYLHAVRGNTLFRNSKDGRFDDESLEAGVTMGRWAWGSNFVDINNDGFDDLIVANGYITNSQADDL